MKQTSVRGIGPDTALSKLTNENLLSLWSEMVRHREVDVTNALIRGERKPASASEEQVFNVGREMAARNLFETSHCLVA